MFDVKCEWLLDGSSALTSAGRVKKFSVTPLCLWIINEGGHMTDKDRWNLTCLCMSCIKLIK